MNQPSEIRPIISSMINKGSFLRMAPDQKCYLYWVNIKKTASKIILQLLFNQSDQELAYRAYTIHTFDHDTATDKIYFAYDPSNYVQILPVPFHSIQDYRDTLEQHYLQLTNINLVKKATQEAWPITANHCIQRILLDRLFEEKWNHQLKQKNKPAYKQLNNVQLGQLLYFSYHLLQEGQSLAVEWNENSLAYRKHVP